MDIRKSDEQLVPLRRREPATPEAALMTEVLQRAIAPTVQATREQLFRQTEAPFESTTAAIRWIEGQARTLPRPSKAATAAAKRLDRRVMKLLAQGSELTMTEWWLDRRVATLSYVKPPSLYPVVIALPSGPGVAACPLVVLQTAVEQMAKATGFAEEALVAHVLTGTGRCVAEPSGDRRPTLLPAGWENVHQRSGPHRPERARCFVPGAQRDLSSDPEEVAGSDDTRAYGAGKAAPTRGHCARCPPANRPCSQAFWEGGAARHEPPLPV